MSHTSTSQFDMPALATSAPKGSGTILWCWGIRQDVSRLLGKGETAPDAVNMAVDGRLEVQRRRNVVAK